jgi:hypothetical protein
VIETNSLEDVNVNHEYDDVYNYKGSKSVTTVKNSISTFEDVYNGVLVPTANKIRYYKIYGQKSCPQNGFVHTVCYGCFISSY